MAEPWFFDVLPCRPPPYADECLSGYLLRLAAANGVSHFGEWVADLFPTWPSLQRIVLLRWEYPIDSWGRIPLRAQLAPSALQRLTIMPWLQKFRAPPVITQEKYLSPGHFVHDIVLSSLQVCPLCLQTQPYIRLLWRLPPVRVCLEHHCLLQTRCHQCGKALTAVGLTQRHLHCPHCSTDLRTLPVVPAATDVLVSQRQRQTACQFLLDPSVALTNVSSLNPAWSLQGPAQAIGLKFRYLRSQTGQSRVRMAQHLNVASTTLASLERGRRVPMSLYLAYLESLSYSWSAFAALELPAEFVEQLDTPPFWPLRLCPTPDCPNHHPPPSLRVTLLADLPERQVARFRCTACGRNFTRSYTGELQFIHRHPPLRPGDPHLLAKSSEEIAQLTEWGLQGLPNRQIAQRLGWGEKTVRMYWIALDLEQQVHAAQRQWKAQGAQQRQAMLRAQIDAILQTHIGQDQEVTLRQIGRALGHNCDYLHSDRILGAYVRAALNAHNTQVQQRRCAHWLARTHQVLDELKQRETPLTIPLLAKQIGLTVAQLQNRYPEIHRLVQHALQEHRARLKVARSQRECRQINEAGTRLAARGGRISGKSLLKEANLSEARIKLDPLVRDALLGWLGNFAPCD